MLTPSQHARCDARVSLIVKKLTMRTSLIIAPLCLGMLAGCATAPIPEPAPSMRCDTAPAREYLGQLATDAVVQNAQQAAGANSVRVLGPNDAATMDYRGDRLNVLVDGQRLITKLTCG